MGVSRLIRRAQATDPDQAETLRIIDGFDQLTAAGASIEQLAQSAADLAGRATWVEEHWNGRRVRAVPAGTTEPVPADTEGISQVVMAGVVGTRLRGRRASVMATDVGQVLVASLDIASGRIGAVWLEASLRKFSVIDFVVTERLAVSVVANALMTHAQVEPRSRVDRAALERLLVGSLDDEEAAIAGKDAQLLPGRKFVSVAIGERPRSAASPDTISQIVARGLAEVGIFARTAVVGSMPVVVAEQADGLVEALEALASSGASLGVSLEFGVGEPGSLRGLSRSWRQAREALVLRAVATSRPVARFSDLGLVHLFAQIPADEVTSFPDYIHVAALAGNRGNPSDLELLETYCDTGSLRATAASLYLHFTSVSYRLARIEEAIGLQLSNPSDKFRAHVAVKLVQIHRATSIEAALRGDGPPVEDAPRTRKRSA